MFHLFSLERQRVFKWRRVSLSYLKTTLILSLLKVSVCDLCTTEVDLVSCVVCLLPFCLFRNNEAPSELQAQPMVIPFGFFM